MKGLKIMRNTQISLLLTTTLWALVCALALSGCGQKTIVMRDRDPAMVARAATLEVWIKDANGKLVKAKRDVQPGEFVVGDANGAKAPALVRAAKPAPAPSASAPKAAATFQATQPAAVEMRSGRYMGALKSVELWPGPPGRVAKRQETSP